MISVTVMVNSSGKMAESTMGSGSKASSMAWVCIAMLKVKTAAGNGKMEKILDGSTEESFILTLFNHIHFLIEIYSYYIITHSQ